MVCWYRNGRKIIWKDSTDNLYREFPGGFLNISPHGLVGILQSDRTGAEKNEILFWRYLAAHNWNSAIVMLAKLPDAARDRAQARLISELTSSQSKAWLHFRQRGQRLRSLRTPVH
jgi:hypothetical protein